MHMDTWRLLRVFRIRYERKRPHTKRREHAVCLRSSGLNPSTTRLANAWNRPGPSPFKFHRISELTEFGTVTMALTLVDEMPSVRCVERGFGRFEQ